MKTQLKFMIILGALIYLSSFTLKAQNIIAEKTTSNFSNINCCDEHKKQQQLTYEEFVNHYGVDDTSLAIVDIYFDKRENSAAGKMSMLPISAAITLVNAPIGVGLMVISTPIFFSGTFTRVKYNRNNLIKVLVKYQNNNILSSNLKEKVTAYLMIKEELRQEEIANTQLASH